MRERDIFIEALQKAGPAERAAYLDATCAGDEALRGRVQDLLAEHEKSKSFLLDAPPVLGANAETIDQPPAAQPGTVVGPYKLLEQIGEGGFGTVFLAQQAHPVRRKVALKVLKAGMDTRQVVARFEAERQALAVMDHPHIAKVFDGGQTDTGRPYFVMELVRGVPITDFCDQSHLTPRERLDLFVQVCQAVQHAHQKGVIHRDLKPNNVLVSAHDGKPAVKVIDFGIAKATGHQLTDKTLFTGFAQMVGTPLYMSPEQAAQSPDVDTRSDVYSLGVLLYELLTGSTPFTKERFRQAAYDEIRRIIREEDPPRPSTRLSESKDSLPSISAQRHTEPAKLSKLVRGELDWIVMKALEKDRSRRYETANGFAADVQRYLAGEAVQAVPPSAGYRFRKFARRNGRALGVAALVLFFLVLLGSGVGWAWRDRAARAEERANHLEQAVERAELLQREGKRGEARAALERAQLLAREAAPAVPLAERIESLQQLLDAEERDDVFVARSAAIRREVQTEVDVKENRFRDNEAHPRLREALEEYGIAVGVTPPADAAAHIQSRPAAIQTVLVAALDECLYHAPRKDSDARQWLFDVLRMADGDSWRTKVRRAWKEPATLEALAKDVDVRQQPPSFLVRVPKALPTKSPSRLDLCRRVQFAYPGDFWATHHLAEDLEAAGKYAEAIRYYSAALSLRPDNPGVLLNRASALRAAGELEAAVADLRRAIAVAPRYPQPRRELSSVLVDQKKPAEALDVFREAIRTNPDDAEAHCDLGDALADQNKFAEAVVSYKTAIRLKPDYPFAFVNLGNALACQGKPDDAIAAFREAIRLKKDIAFAHGRLGTELLLRKGLVDEGIAELRESMRLDPNHYGGQLLLGRTLCDVTGDYDGAIVALREAVRLKPDSFLAHASLGVALRRKGLLDESIAACREAVRLHTGDSYCHLLLGLALSLKGLDEEAADAYREAIRLNPNSAEACNGLGNVLDQNKPDEAIRWYKRAIEINPNDALPHYNLGRVALHRQGKLDEAIDWYRKAIKLDPNYYPSHHGLGHALSLQQKPGEAIASYRRAIELEPKSAGAHRELAALLVTGPDPKLRDPRLALEHARKAVELQGDNVGAWQVLGWAQYRAGNWRESIEALEKSCTLENGGDSGQWIVLALAHAKLAAQENLPDKARAIHKIEARRRFEEASKQMDSWGGRPVHYLGGFTWDFREEARTLFGAKENKK